MTDQTTPAADQSADPFAFLAQQAFIQLTTFRKSGLEVPTTVWFAPDGDRLYVTTQSTAGKIKRLSHTERVILRPSNAAGQLLSEESVEARAHELPAAEHQRAYDALKRKYGEQFTSIVGSADFQQVTRTYIEIEPLRAA